MTLYGLERKKTATKSIEEFVSSATLKTVDSNNPKAKRDQSILLYLNPYEINKINEGFKSSGCKSKQEYLRGLIFKDNNNENMQEL